MAYDQMLAGRIRAVLGGQPDVVEKKMFGGLAFMLHGNMCCGVIKDTLMVRVGPQHYESALALPHARELDFTGRPMRGMVVVDPPALTTDADLVAWVERGVQFTSALPAKGT